jgi:hypothetical protein
MAFLFQTVYLAYKQAAIEPASIVAIILDLRKIAKSLIEEADSHGRIVAFTETDSHLDHIFGLLIQTDPLPHIDPLSFRQRASLHACQSPTASNIRNSIHNKYFQAGSQCP